MRPSIAICPARLDSTRNPPVKPGGKKRAVEECWQSTRWHFALNTRIRTHGIGIAYMQDSPLRRICFGPVINECPAAPKAASAPAPTSSQIGGVGYCKQRMCELSFAFFIAFACAFGWDAAERKLPILTAQTWENREESSRKIQWQLVVRLSIWLTAPAPQFWQLSTRRRKLWAHRPSSIEHGASKAASFQEEGKQIEAHTAGTIIYQMSIGR